MDHRAAAVPERAAAPERRWTTTRALVLGAGGRRGLVWSALTLRRLEQEQGWDARRADIIVGTGAGAELGALLSRGFSTAQVLGALRHDPTTPRWLQVHLNGRAAGVPWPLPTSPRLAVRGLRPRAPARLVLAGLSPLGRRRDTELVEGLGDRWGQDAWLWLVAVDTATGERVPFGAPRTPHAGLRDALRAATATPGVGTPVRIGGRRYVGGAAASATSADLAIDAGVDELVVVAPAAGRDAGRHPLRAAAARRLATEVGWVRAAGIATTVLAPGPQRLPRRKRGTAAWRGVGGV